MHMAHLCGIFVRPVLKVLDLEERNESLSLSPNLSWLTSELFLSLWLPPTLLYATPGLLRLFVCIRVCMCMCIHSSCAIVSARIRASALVWNTHSMHHGTGMVASESLISSKTLFLLAMLHDTSWPLTDFCWFPTTTRKTHARINTHTHTHTQCYTCYIAPGLMGPTTCWCLRAASRHCETPFGGQPFVETCPHVHTCNACISFEVCKLQDDEHVCIHECMNSMTIWIPVEETTWRSTPQWCMWSASQSYMQTWSSSQSHPSSTRFFLFHFSKTSAHRRENNATHPHTHTHTHTINADVYVHTCMHLSADVIPGSLPKQIWVFDNVLFKSSMAQILSRNGLSAYMLHMCACMFTWMRCKQRDSVLIIIGHVN
jgi:hypothetical protein